MCLADLAAHFVVAHDLGTPMKLRFSMASFNKPLLDAGTPRSWEDAPVFQT